MWSMDWLKGKSTPETMVFTIKYRGVPVKLPIIQFDVYDESMRFQSRSVLQLWIVVDSRSARICTVKACQSVFFQKPSIVKSFSGQNQQRRTFVGTISSDFCIFVGRDLWPDDGTQMMYPNQSARLWCSVYIYIYTIKGSLGGETSVLRTFRMSGKELVKERVSKERVRQGKS